MAHYIWMRLGISAWKAHRWVAAAHALESLPAISEALASGELSIDKVVKLTRFATPETERRLVSWAQGVSCGAIRHRGDLASRKLKEETLDANRDRRLRWWDVEGGRIGLEAELPAADGAVVIGRIQEVARAIPVMPGETGPFSHEARRADALVAICSTKTGEGSDLARPTLVVHASLDALAGTQGAEVEAGPVISSQAARRLACTARVQMMVEVASGDPVRVGTIRRDPPEWMLRQLRYRDRECRFSGCGARQFLQAHHIEWWDRGGRTTLENLILICFFHHRLVHEYGWSVKRDRQGTVSWFYPNDHPYRAGPAPPRAETYVHPAVLAV